MMTVSIVLGAIAALAGASLVVTGIRRGPDAAPGNMVMLIGGMMLAAFGILIAGFNIVYSHSAPLDLNAGAAR
jgi:drug/metabolite transporter (DMT)-like permease